MLQRFVKVLRPFGYHILESRVSSELPFHGKLCSAFSTYRNLNALAQQHLVLDSTQISNKKENHITQDVISKVNEHIRKGDEGRLFAVIHVCGKQFKVTPEDIIIIEGHWAPQNGDEIKLEKVMLVGGLEFTLIGRPVLPPDLVTVTATVIEKDLSHTKTIFFKKRRKQYQRINFFRSQLTMLRINEVSVTGKINDHNAVTQYERI